MALSGRTRLWSRRRRSAPRTRHTHRAAPRYMPLPGTDSQPSNRRVIARNAIALRWSRPAALSRLKLQRANGTTPFAPRQLASMRAATAYGKQDDRETGLGAARRDHNGLRERGKRPRLGGLERKPRQLQVEELGCGL